MVEVKVPQIAHADLELSAEMVRDYRLCIGAPTTSIGGLPLLTAATRWIDVAGKLFPEIEGGSFPWVQTSHAVEVHKIIEPPVTLFLAGELRGIRPTVRGTVVTFEVTVSDATSSRVLASHASTVFSRSELPVASYGEIARPVTRASGDPIAAFPLTVSTFTTERYASFSGDRNPIHLSAAASAEAGFDAPVAHGLCGLAMACAKVLEQRNGPGPGVVRKLSARFNGPILVGAELRTTVRALPGKPKVASFAVAYPSGPVATTALMEVS